MGRVKAYLLLAVSILLAACNGINRPYEGEYENVLIYCALGYNNLSSNLIQNFEDIQEGVLPGISSNCAIVAFCHNTTTYQNYVDPNPPRLIRILRDSNGRPVADTLKTYDDITLSPTRDALRAALSDIADLFPAKHYGMLFSSHGTGWIPAGYDTKTKPAGLRASGSEPAATSHVWPETKAVGNQYINSYKNVRWLELSDFVDAIPVKLDYLILDACLMGTVEVAYGLKDVCRYLVASPAEILTTGMIYKTLSWDMLSGHEPDLQTYCEEYFEYYNSASGDRRAGTISLVDCEQLEPLAQAFKAIIDAHRDGIEGALAGTQRYFYSSSNLRFFYDLQDFAAQLGASDAELARLDDALAGAVLYHAETPAFFDLPLERCCGLSVYIPEASRTRLNDYYTSLGWNRRTGLVQ